MVWNVKVACSIFAVQMLMHISSSGVQGNATQQLKLRKKVFGNPSNIPNDKVNIVPRKYENESLPVDVSFTMISLVAYNEKDEVMVTNGILNLRWNDVGLTWNEQDNGGIKVLSISQGHIWKPDLRLVNTVVNHKQLGDDDLLVKVSSDGSVDWKPGDVFHTSCSMDISMYPLDDQRCDLKFCTRMNTPDEVSFNVSSNTIDIQQPDENGQWDIMHTDAEKLNTSHRSECVIFSIHIKRRPYFYVINTLIPLMMMSFINSFVFLLPIESGEKISMCTALLLSFAVFLSFVTDNMPNTSSNLPFLGVYVAAMLLLSGLSIIVSVLLSLCYHRREEQTTNDEEEERKRKLPTFLKEPKSQIQNMWQYLIYKKRKVDSSHATPSTSAISTFEMENQHRGNDKAQDIKQDVTFCCRRRRKSQRLSPAKKFARTMDLFCFFLFFSIASAGTITLLGLLNVRETGLANVINDLADTGLSRGS